MHADECYKGEYFGGGWNIDVDLTNEFPPDWRDFNTKYRPVYLENNPGKGKVAAGLACGMLYTLCKGMNKGDIALCPNGKGAYYVGEVVGDYSYAPGEKLPHRRKVKWYSGTIARSEMTQALQRSTGSAATVADIRQYAKEIETLISSDAPPQIVANDERIEDPSVFALEKHLEEFLIKNWEQTDLGVKYDIFKDENGDGQQYQADTGFIDILAISKDKKELLVVELKKGYASDNVVGQILRYMGYVTDELAEEGQKVRGVIVALEDDLRIRRALSVAKGVEFYRYKVDFKLFKVDI